MNPIESLRVTSVDMAHTPRDIASRCLQQQVIMVGHQTVRRNLEIPDFRRFPHHLAKGFLVLLGNKYLFPSSAPIHHMIPGVHSQHEQRVKNDHANPNTEPR